MSANYSMSLLRTLPSEDEEELLELTSSSEDYEMKDLWIEERQPVAVECPHEDSTASNDTHEISEALVYGDVDGISDAGVQLDRLSLNPAASRTNEGVSEIIDLVEQEDEEDRAKWGLSSADVRLFRETMQKARKRDGTEFGSFGAHDILRLDHDEWLNDEIVNAFMKLMQQDNAKRAEMQETARCHFFNSFFLPCMVQEYDFKALERWTQAKRLRRWGQTCPCILECPLIFFPYFAFSHWSLIAADLRSKTLTHYDSMKAPGAKEPKVHLNLGADVITDVI